MTWIRALLRRRWLLLRTGLSLALLAGAINHVEWRTVVLPGREIEYPSLLAALAVQLSASGLAGLRWGWLMRRANYLGPLRDYVALYFAGGLINQGLPTVIGGDSYRAVAACRLQDERAARGFRDGLFVVLLDRTLGLTGNNVLGAAGLIFGDATLAAWAVTLGHIILGCLRGGVLLIALLLRLATVSGQIVSALEKLGMRHVLAAIQGAWGLPWVPGQIAYAVTIHLLTLCAMGLCLRAVGAAIPLEALLVGMPALGLLLLPISISGWGLREATLAAVLGLWGVPASQTILASIFYGAIGFVALLPGAYRLVWRRKAVTGALAWP